MKVGGDQSCQVNIRTGLKNNINLIMKKNHTILLADDHTILRAGLRSILNSKSDLDVVAEVDNGNDAVKLALTIKPDLLLTDLSMPKKNGTDAIRELKKRMPDLKCLVLTMHATEEHIHMAFNAGANGYILKDDSHEELITAINTVLKIGRASCRERV